MVARFIRAKKDSRLPERQRGGRLEGSGCPEVLAELPCVSLGLGKSGLSFPLSILFLGFSWACPSALPQPIFPGFSQARALPLSNLFPRLSQALSSPSYGHCFVSYAELIVLLVIWLLLHKRLVKGTPAPSGVYRARTQ